MLVDVMSFNNVAQRALNIKYAINGTGKSAVAKAILAALYHKKNVANELLKLKPLKSLTDDAVKLAVIGVLTS